MGGILDVGVLFVVWVGVFDKVFLIWFWMFCLRIWFLGFEFCIVCRFVFSLCVNRWVVGFVWGKVLLFRFIGGGRDVGDWWVVCLVMVWVVWEFVELVVIVFGFGVCVGIGCFGVVVVVLDLVSISVIIVFWVTLLLILIVICLMILLNGVGIFMVVLLFLSVISGFFVLILLLGVIRIFMILMDLKLLILGRLIFFGLVMCCCKGFEVVLWMEGIGFVVVYVILW